jgi:hypothetical protein
MTKKEEERRKQTESIFPDDLGNVGNQIVLKKRTDQGREEEGE